MKPVERRRSRQLYGWVSNNSKLEVDIMRNIINGGGGQPVGTITGGGGQPIGIGGGGQPIEIGGGGQPTDIGGGGQPGNI